MDEITRVPNTPLHPIHDADLIEFFAALDADYRADPRGVNKADTVRALLRAGIAAQAGATPSATPSATERAWTDEDIDALLDRMVERGLVATGEAGEAPEREEAVDLSEMVLDADTLGDFL
jgi:hypothetical protein